MLTHLLKLVWNKKKQNFLLLVEIFVSFMVIFTFFSLTVNCYKNYRQPIGFEYSEVLSVAVSKIITAKDTVGVVRKKEDLFYESLKRTLQAVPGVQEVSYFSSNFPFSDLTNQNLYEHKKAKAFSNCFDVEDDYLKVVNLTLVAGRWFSKEDDASAYQPIVISQSLKDSLFGRENAIGKIINNEKVIGIINNIKDKSEFQQEYCSVFKRLKISEAYPGSVLLIKVDPSSKELMEARIYKALTGIRMLSNVEMEYLSSKKLRKDNFVLIPMLIFFIIACFLIINVALGLFGVIWYNINQRKAEIGLRRAIGAKGTSVSIQLIGEALVLASIAMVAGCFFAIQLQLLNFFDLPSSTYTIAMVLSILFIYLLVILSAIYPGRQAAFILPAVALHED